MQVLVVNAGSSSLKLQLLGDDDKVLANKTVERWAGEQDLDDLKEFVQQAKTVDAIGHRVVHGGARFSGPARVNDDVLNYLTSIIDLAPLHQPRALGGIRALQSLLPDVPSVACFDTAFHKTIPPEAATYALPREWKQRWAIRRYGFHGLSHAYASRRGAEIIGSGVEDLRIVSCHLGAGASLAAVRHGRSADTTMGFTPLEGLVMVTRSGSVDPGLVLWLLRNGELSLSQVEDALEHQAGLAGLSGTSGDLRDVLDARAKGDADATLAFDVFTHRLARELAAMTAAAGGVDLVVMTGGIGEHSAETRQVVADRLAYLGMAVNDSLNQTTTSDGEISGPDAAVRTVVVTAREDLEVARQVRTVLASA